MLKVCLWGSVSYLNQRSRDGGCCKLCGVTVQWLQIRKRMPDDYIYCLTRQSMHLKAQYVVFWYKFKSEEKDPHWLGKINKLYSTYWQQGCPQKFFVDQGRSWENLFICLYATKWSWISNSDTNIQVSFVIKLDHTLRSHTGAGVYPSIRCWCFSHSFFDNFSNYTLE